MNMTTMRNFRSIFSTTLALTIGVLAGAGVALLYAPNSGQDTRHKLLTKGEELKEKVSHDVTTTKAQLQNQFTEVNKAARSKAYELGNQLNKTIAATENTLKEKVNDLRIPSLSDNSR